VRSPEHWDRLAIRRLTEDLYADHHRITEAVVTSQPDAGTDAAWAAATLEDWAQAHAFDVERAEESLTELEQGGWTLAKVALGSAILREFAGLTTG
jgi:glutamate dehydrogenase